MITLKLACLSVKAVTARERTEVISTLRHKHKVAVLLQISGLARSTCYYHVKQTNKPDKYNKIKEKIYRAYHENRGRYGYRRIKAKLKGLPSALHRLQALSRADQLFV